MNWQDYKKIVDDPNFYLNKAVAVAEVDYFIAARELKLTEEQTEVLYSFVYDTIINSNVGGEEIADIITRGLADEEISMEDFDDYDTDSGNSVVDEWFENQL